MEGIKRLIPEHLKDARLNTAVLLEEDDAGFPPSRRLGVALAVALSLGNGRLAASLREMLAGSSESDGVQRGAALAASLMAMNNTYYGALGLIGDSDLLSMPARLRMNGIQSPPCDRVLFELMSLAVSAVGKCQGCLKSHARSLAAEGVSKATVQSALRVAAVTRSIDVAMGPREA